MGSEKKDECVDLMLLRQFQQQAELQCRYSFTAAQMLDKAVEGGEMQGTFFAAQMLVTSLGNVAKVFWGSGGRKAKAREPVRRSIGVSDGSPLKNVAMRNHYEHLDERIEGWWNSSKSRNIADHLIGPPGMIEGIEPIGMFRQFDPSTGKLHFWSDEFDLREIMQDMAGFFPRLQKEAAKPHWE